jgi:hypothetical protein
MFRTPAVSTSRLPPLDLSLEEGEDLLQRKEIQIPPVAGRQAKIGMQQVAQLYSCRREACRGDSAICSAGLRSICDSVEVGTLGP